MHLGIDITAAIYGRGVSRYTTNLVRGLSKIPQLELSLFGSSLRQKATLDSLARSLPQPPKYTSFQNYPPSAVSWLWRLGLNSIRSQLPHLDVFHSWDWLQPPDKDLPLVSTIHDLAILKYPDTAHPDVLRMHQRSWKHLKKHRAQIIAVSQNTKRDIMKYLEIPSEKIHVIPEALPVEFEEVSNALSEESFMALKNHLKLSKPYVLFVGTREPRKNLHRLIEAWKPLSADYELIIAGEAGWDETSKQSHPNLRFLGKVSDAALAVLYAEAEIFCYPSLDEGFGLPILEAFFHGTPVLTSNAGGTAEVAGNAALLIDPTSVDSMRTGLTQLLNEELPEQKRRLQRMIIRLQMFNWQSVALQTTQVYQRALESYA